ncbi:MAG: thiamine phosphate synthase [Oscillospiraceae bacterium]|nr:thiamine phosphate synthase [Oscillospiraceae bacterium]
MKFSADMLRLYAVTDRRWLNGRTLADAVDSAIRGGVTCVQLREKSLDGGDLLNEAKQVLAVCRKYHVPLIINDDPQIALACGADGVHVGQQDMSPRILRAMLGPEKIVGVSAATVDEAVQAAKDGADYLGCGAVFATGTKTNTRPVDAARLRAVCEASAVPVVAIGGITAENAPVLQGSGIAGIAVVSAIFAQPDPEAAAVQLRTISEEL